MTRVRNLAFAVMVLAFATAAFALPDSWDCAWSDDRFICVWVDDAVLTSCSQQEAACNSACNETGINGDLSFCFVDEGMTHGACVCNGYCQVGMEAPDCGSTGSHIWNWQQCQCVPDPSPIIIGLEPGAYHLTSVADGVQFDFDGDGQNEQISWTRQGLPLAFLVLDRNGNGRIDNGGELFGNETRLLGGGYASNGFEALSDLDANVDGQIDSADPQYSSLRLWVDANHNGVSEAGELAGLSSEEIVSVSTSFRDGKRTDQFGNRFAFVGSMVQSQGQNDKPQTKKIYDVFLKLDATE